jgi:signal transduction histidine kinase
MMQGLRQPRWLGQFTIFWRVVVVISLGLGAHHAARADPGLLASWRGGLMLLLMAAFAVAYELFEQHKARRMEAWPVPYRSVLAYLVVQLAITTGLLLFSPSFFGPLLSLMGHTFSSLPMRRWPVPTLAIAALLAAPIGVYAAIAEADWGSVVGFVFSMVMLIALAIFVGVLFSEHYKNSILIHELRRAKDELERYATQAEELAVLRERTRLAREMHDSLGHALVLVNVKLEAAQRLYAVEAARGDAELEATRSLVRETMGELRRSLADLRSPVPDYHDLPLALERLSQELRGRTAIAVTCRVAATLPLIQPEIAEALWRIACEALSNVERHAAAGCAEIALERAGGMLLLRITDDGSGIAQEGATQTGHYGIVGMRERAAALGGTLQIGARDGGGTVVVVRVPL